MRFGRTFASRIVLELTTAAPEHFLEDITRENITLYHVTITGEFTICFEIADYDHAVLLKYCEKRGESLRVLEKYGFSLYFSSIWKHPVLLLGVFFSILAVLWIPSYVFFIQVEGNQQLPDRYILEAAQSCGICFGANRRAIRSEQVKNALLEKIPQLQWAGVNTRGCVAVISVREKNDEKPEKQSSGIFQIAASRDGIITSCTAYQGNMLCSEGQAVTRGQTLISAYTDCGLSIQVESAEGEIYAQTQRQVTAVLPRIWTVKHQETCTRRRFGFLVGKKRINLWKDSGIWDTSCDRMYQEYYVVLPGEFQLPIGMWIESISEYRISTNMLESSSAEENLKAYAREFLSAEMIAGNILQPQEQISVSDTLLMFRGDYICSEMIGVLQPEKIGEIYGKTD